MGIPDEKLYEYALIRYVPRVDREEFVNIGLIMMCKRRRWLRGGIFLDEARLHAFDPQVNIESLKIQASLFMRDDVPSRDIPVEERYRWLSAVKSAVLQVSPSHPGLLVEKENPLDQQTPDGTSEGTEERLNYEFERLFKELVACCP